MMIDFRLIITEVNMLISLIDFDWLMSTNSCIANYSILLLAIDFYFKL